MGVADAVEDLLGDRVGDDRRRFARGDEFDTHPHGGDRAGGVGGVGLAGAADRGRGQGDDRERLGKHGGRAARLGEGEAHGQGEGAGHALA